MPGATTLADWRKAEDISQKEMASRLSARLGRTVHPPSICQWESGIMPGADAAEAIRVETGGEGDRRHVRAAAPMTVGLISIEGAGQGLRAREFFQ